MRNEASVRIREALRALEEARSAVVETETLRSALAEIGAALERMERRGAVLAAQQQLLDDRLLRVENNRLFRVWSAVVGWVLDLRRRAGGSGIGESPAEEYAVWTAHERAALPAPEEARRAVEGWRVRPRFSVVTWTGGETAGRALEWLRAQAYPEWEACVGGPGAAAGLAAAAGQATGDYLVFLGPEDVLSPFALYFVAEALQWGSFDVGYADEDRVDSAGGRCRPHFKPGWSPALLERRMYLGRPLIVRREWFVKRGGLSPESAQAHFHEMARRLTEGAAVRHIPRVLCHRPADAPDDPDLPQPTRQAGGPMTAVICSRTPRLLESCLKSLRATASRQIPEIVVVAHEEGGPNEALREAARRHGAAVVSYGGAFNFSDMNNRGAAAAAGPHLLFLNDDVLAHSPGWAEELAGELELPGTGIVGAVLRYPSGALQHAGLVTGMVDGVGHAGRWMERSELWPWLLETRNVSAVSGACMAVRAEVFAALGGFDPAFPNNYNDVDLCFRAAARGWKVVCAAVPGLVHAECRTRRGLVRFEERLLFFERWAEVLACPDPYYSPSLAPAERIGLRLGGGWACAAVLAEAGTEDPLQQE